MTDTFEKIAVDAKKIPFAKALAQGQAIAMQFEDVQVVNMPDRFFIHRAVAVSAMFIVLAITVVIF